MDFFTLINQLDGQEHRIHFEKYANVLRLKMYNHNIIILEQQLYELGSLFIALAGNNVDKDSVHELLDGYKLHDNL